MQIMFTLDSYAEGTCKSTHILLISVLFALIYMYMEFIIPRQTLEQANLFPI